MNGWWPLPLSHFPTELLQIAEQIEQLPSPEKWQPLNSSWYLNISHYIKRYTVNLVVLKFNGGGHLFGGKMSEYAPYGVIIKNGWATLP